MAIDDLCEPHYIQDGVSATISRYTNLFNVIVSRPRYCALAPLLHVRLFSTSSATHQTADRAPSSFLELSLVI
jgi:hypothetical protein